MQNLRKIWTRSLSLAATLTWAHLQLSRASAFKHDEHFTSNAQNPKSRAYPGSSTIRPQMLKARMGLKFFFTWPRRRLMLMQHTFSQQSIHCMTWHTSFVLICHSDYTDMQHQFPFAWLKADYNTCVGLAVRTVKLKLCQLRVTFTRYWWPGISN